MLSLRSSLYLLSGIVSSMPANDNGVERTLGKILATQEYIIKQIEDYNKRLDEHINEDKELDKRLTKIEHNRSYLLGMVAAVSVFVTYAGDIVMTKVGLK
jgi:hypothetical protein